MCKPNFLTDDTNATVNHDVHALDAHSTVFLDEDEFLRWFPWKKAHHHQMVRATEDGEECVERGEEHSSIDEFPTDLFTRNEPHTSVNLYCNSNM